MIHSSAPIMPKIDTNSEAQSLFKIIWKDLSYEVNLNKNSFLASKNRKIIENLNGDFISSSLIGILGPPGCGKSSLLKCLSRKVKKGVTGEISLVGHESVRISFIPQHDHHFQHLTTKETLIFASKLLRNGRTLSDQLVDCPSTSNEINTINSRLMKGKKISPADFHHEIADLMLAELQLTHVKDHNVDNLSDGQRRRLSIGQVLIGNPDIVFLDEPVSGLDSFSNLICLTLLKHYSKLSSNEGHDFDSDLFKKKSNMVVATVQPSKHLIELFDELLFIGEKAKFIYKDSPTNLIPTLHKNGVICSEHCSPAEIILEIISGLHGKELKNNLSNQIRYNYLNRNYDRTIDNQFACHCRTSVFNEITTLLRRDFIILIRGLEGFSRIFYFLFVGLFIGLLFGNEASEHSACPQLGMVIAYLTNNNFIKNFHDQNYTTIELEKLKTKYLIQENWEISTQQMLTTNLSNFGFSIMVCLIGSVLPFTVYMPKEMAITLIEHSNSFYSINSYLIAKFISELPFTLVPTILFACMTYLMNQQIFEWFRFLIYITIFSIVALIGQLHGMIVGVLWHKNINTIIFLGPICLIPYLLFCGIFIRVEILSSLFQYLTYFSHLKYSFEAILLAIYSYDRCVPTEFQDIVYLKSLIKNLKRRLFSMLHSMPLLNPNDDFFKTQTVQQYININGDLFNLSEYLNNFDQNGKQESLLFRTILVENKSILHKYCVLLVHYLVYILILYQILKWKLRT